MNMEIFAHRGLLNDFPENSLTSLIGAFKEGFGIEFDLRLTKDNDFIIIHDDNFQRLTGQDIDVKNLTLSQVREINYINSQEKIISLGTLLEAVRLGDFKKKLAIHLKADSQTEEGLGLLAKYIREFNLYDQAFAFDLTLESAKLLRQIDKKIKTALIVSEYRFEPTIFLWEEVKQKDFDIVWMAEWRKFYSYELINEMKSDGKIVYAMSPDVHRSLGHPLAREGFEETWRTLIDWNVDGICTDQPKKLSLYCSHAIV